MPIQDQAGKLVGRPGKGTPQGGVISPLLANLYLHYTLERWFEINFPDVCFVRYADEVTVHCKSKEQAEEVLQAVKSGLAAAKLSIRAPLKTP